MWQEYALARGQERHQRGVVVVILGEQSMVISRERRSSRPLTWRLANTSLLSSAHFSNALSLGHFASGFQDARFQRLFGDSDPSS